MLGKTIWYRYASLIGVVHRLASHYPISPTEADIGLLNEAQPTNINTIPWALTAWPGELLDEIIPKQTQAMIEEKNVWVRQLVLSC